MKNLRFIIIKVRLRIIISHKVTGGVLLDSFQKPNGFLHYLKDHVDNVTVQMHNATTHNLAKGESIKCRIKQLSWPANSPDLNPIENVWKQMKKKILSPTIMLPSPMPLKKFFRF